MNKNVNVNGQVLPGMIGQIRRKLQRFLDG